MPQTFLLLAGSQIEVKDSCNMRKLSKDNIQKHYNGMNCLIKDWINKYVESGKNVT